MTTRARAGLRGQLARLERLSAADLRDEWQAVVQSPCPRLAPALLRLGIAHRLQLEAMRVPDPVKRLLAGSGTARCASAAPSPGTQLVRSWNGRTVSVLVEETGFAFAGKLYPSLSAIAREVTGAHWSGPRFFGLSGRADANG